MNPDPDLICDGCGGPCNGGSWCDDCDDAETGYHARAALRAATVPIIDHYRSDLLHCVCRACRQSVEVNTPPDMPAPCPVCGRTMPTHTACPHCDGSGWVEATRFNGADAGPCGECQGTGVGPVVGEVPA